MAIKDKQLPDSHGYFGQYGGKFVPETLMSALDELEKAYLEAQADIKFQKQFNRLYLRPFYP